MTNAPKNVISEVGWPSEGGNSCGEVNCTSSTQGSVAGINEMNRFMADFVCQSMSNGTEYFWYVLVFGTLAHPLTCLRQVRGL
jgi:exo-beta-1,3-glucanase (GH17 family)